MLQLNDITKNFGAVKALQNAELRMQPGEIRALLGANGSGKSTMVKVLGGLVRKDEGTILLDGNPVEIPSPKTSRKYGIAVAYQDLSLVPRLSVADNIMLGHEPRALFGMTDRRKVMKTALEILETLNANTSPDDLVMDLDSSTQSLVEIAKALSWNPRMLLLDEVTASLHKDQVQRVFSLLKKLKSSGLSILFVSHRMDEVFELCDTATILRGGKTAAAVTINEVTEGDIVFHMTGMRLEQIKREAKETEFAGERACVLSVKELVVPPRVNGVTMKAYAGEIIGIGGLQGQGQGEFLRSVYGSIPYAGGSVEVSGKRVRYKAPADSIRDGFGFIPGDREREGIFQVRPVADNIYISMLAKRSLVRYVDPKSILEGAREMIGKLKIVAGSPNHPANSLSGGNQQKLVVGRWLEVMPKILLLDDPTKGVDITSRREIHDLLRHMAQAGTTVIISSSDNEELLDISDRILVFYEGRIVEELTGPQRKEEFLVQAMLGVNGEAGSAGNGTTGSDMNGSDRKVSR